MNDATQRMAWEQITLFSSSTLEHISVLILLMEQFELNEDIMFD